MDELETGPQGHHRTELRAQALAALCEADIERKRELTLALQAAANWLPLDTRADLTPAPDHPLPGRPALPRLVPPKEVAQRSPFTPEGRAALVHAICHIEFNAINLALDAVWRFAGMPRQFYLDWLRVAAEEAYHYGLLREHLQTIPHPETGRHWDYGDFDAHDGLWTMCTRTAHDVTARMALVPRTLEARGLDATPQIQAKLGRVGTPDALAAVGLLDIILRDEVGHVEIGNRWYRWLCERDGLDPVAQYPELVKRYQAPPLRPPFNQEARLRAGFSRQELDYLLGA
ncbi:MAG: hypothetical protein RLZZ555_1607 [Pseudomonadota bacterium]|jgi:uncharacterized ferritin-like protein (DUF455 family)